MKIGGRHLTFGGLGAGEFLVLYGRKVNVNVGAIHQRPGDPGDVLLNLRGRTTAIVSRIIREAALAGVHGQFVTGVSMPKNRFLLLIPKKSTR